ncbi:hypothetical protein AWZ03_014055, partial [Drosophila navojoa]
MPMSSAQLADHNCIALIRILSIQLSCTIDIDIDVDIVIDTMQPHTSSHSPATLMCLLI